ncbi:L,D-transpeptidase YcbB [Vibrio variabilis]|uniref:L,D-transpeptidase YcbB n=1 Tax=Vibrio variabilis TaxID=990271 RepID=A0ABQ0JMZ1_9VIBR|nr:L,D-transpeptidase YcbB [Vibrio variabilis]
MRNWLIMPSILISALSSSVAVTAAPDQLVSDSSELTSYSVKHIEPILKSNQQETHSTSNVETLPQEELLYPELVEYLYSRLQRIQLWSDQELNAQVNLQLDVVRLAGFSPIFQERVEMLHDAFQQQDKSRYDRLTTDTFLLYMSYVASAADSGKEWYFTTSLQDSLPRPSATEVDIMVTAFESGRETDYVRSLASPMIQQPGFENVYIDLFSQVTGGIPCL